MNRCGCRRESKLFFFEVFGALLLDDTFRYHQASALELAYSDSTVVVLLERDPTGLYVRETSRKELERLSQQMGSISDLAVE